MCLFAAEIGNLSHFPFISHSPQLKDNIAYSLQGSFEVFYNILLE